MRRSISCFCLAFFLLVGFFSSCERVYENAIPRVPVFYEVFFQSAQGRRLLAPGSNLVVYRPELSEHSIGYGGLIIVHSISETDRFYAYDLACPHEAQREIKLGITPSSEAVCPVCHSRFDLLYGSGAPIEGPSRSPLMRYSVYPIPGGLRITN